MFYSVQEISRLTGLSAHTLRYYEKEGLLCEIQRTSGGIRRYTDEDLEALGLICCLKNTGMPLAEIRDFIALTRQGDQTLGQRCEILRAHREEVIQNMKQMQSYLDKVTWKLDFFTEKLKLYQEQTRE